MYGPHSVVCTVFRLGQRLLYIEARQVLISSWMRSCSLIACLAVEIVNDGLCMMCIEGEMEAAFDKGGGVVVCGLGGALLGLLLFSVTWLVLRVGEVDLR